MNRKLNFFYLNIQSVFAYYRSSNYTKLIEIFIVVTSLYQFKFIELVMNKVIIRKCRDSDMINMFLL